MEKEIFVDGRKIVYSEDGRGPPFLLIHGWGPEPVQHFSSFQKLLAGRGYKVISPHLPGFENGEPTPAGWGMEEYLNCVLGFINALKLDSFFLIGHSMGGAMAIRMAVACPDKIKALILLSPGIFPSARLHFWKWWIFLIGFRIFLIMIRIINLVHLWGALHRFLFQKGKSMPDLLKRFVAIENTPLYLPKILTRTLILWGGRDFNYYLLGRNLVKRIPDHRIHIITGAGHNIQEDAPQKALDLIMDFIKLQEGP